MAQVNDDKKPMDAAATANYKQLKIQSGALNRYTKELKYYMKELTELKAKLDEMRNAAENDEKQNDKNKQIEIKQQVLLLFNI